MSQSKHGLGRGLSSLIPNKQQFIGLNQDLAIEENLPVRNNNILYINPKLIKANPFQPRNQFQQDKLDELADSIMAHGIITPLSVTQSDQGYELISGERRLRAALNLDLPEVPVIVRQAVELEKLELALIENIQRQDLNLIEQAHGYQRLIDEFSLTQAELSKKLGKSRPQIANTLRLLGLPEAIRQSLINQEISEGHAKVILSLPDSAAQLNLWKKITLNKFTVRASEQEARRIQVKTHSRKVKAGDPNLVAIEEKLEARLGTRVNVKGTLDKGQIVVDYFSREELDNIISNF